MAGKARASKPPSSRRPNHLHDQPTKGCIRCGGDGREPNMSDKAKRSLRQHWVACPRCKGSGRVPRMFG